MTPFSLELQVQKVPEMDARTFPAKLVNSVFHCLLLDSTEKDGESLLINH